MRCCRRASSLGRSSYVAAGDQGWDSRLDGRTEGGMDGCMDGWRKGGREGWMGLFDSPAWLRFCSGPDALRLKPLRRSWLSSVLPAQKGNEHGELSAIGCCCWLVTMSLLVCCQEQPSLQRQEVDIGRKCCEKSSQPQPPQIHRPESIRSLSRVYRSRPMEAQGLVAPR